MVKIRAFLSRRLNLQSLVPYTYPKLSTSSAITSPFSIVFEEVGAGVLKFCQTVIVTFLTSSRSRRGVIHEYRRTHLRYIRRKP